MNEQLRYSIPAVAPQRSFDQLTALRWRMEPNGSSPRRTSASTYQNNLTATTVSWAALYTKDAIKRWKDGPTSCKQVVLELKNRFFAKFAWHTGVTSSLLKQIAYRLGNLHQMNSSRLSFSSSTCRSFWKNCKCPFGLLGASEVTCVSLKLIPENVLSRFGFIWNMEMKSGAWSGSAFQHRRSTPSDLARVPHSLRRIPFVELAFTNLMAMMRLLSHQKHSGLKHDFWETAPIYVSACCKNCMMIYVRFEDAAWPAASWPAA